ncbi:hypothetical protein TWF788_007566 [Orbilia oligospora]|uniref:DUF7707 domain-containing protein n=1 Tax=Orbilia oligospora TaxID=2813651 RepID=A0A7C8PSS4_ORBOL|nr:hypothetical protein TWF788_007566 [Orbilia oligospora]
MSLQLLVAFGLLIANRSNLSAAQTIDPGSVSPIIRDGWCTSQENVCSTLCGDFDNKVTWSIYTGNSSSPENQAECRSAYACPSLDVSAAGQTSNDPEVSQTPNPPPSPAPSPTSSLTSFLTSSITSELRTTGARETSGPSGSSTITEQSSSARTTTPTSRSTDTTLPTDKVDGPPNTEAGPPTKGPNSPLDSNSPTPGSESKGLGTPAIVGIAVGVGVPVLLLAVFVAYRLGSRRNYPPVPVVPHSAFDKEYGGSEYPGGGNDPGIGFGNEIGGISRNNYTTTRT